MSMERAVSSCSSADTLDSARAVKLLAALAQALLISSALFVAAYWLWGVH